MNKIIQAIKEEFPNCNSYVVCVEAPNDEISAKASTAHIFVDGTFIQILGLGKYIEEIALTKNRIN